MSNAIAGTMELEAVDVAWLFADFSPVVMPNLLDFGPKKSHNYGHLHKLGCLADGEGSLKISIFHPSSHISKKETSNSDYPKTALLTG